MVRTAVLFLVPLISVLSAEAEDAGRIVNGTEVPEGKYPFMVSMQYNGEHFCGGSIVNEKWMMTAAHCAVPFRPQKYLSKVRIVSSTNKLSSGGREHRVTGLKIHEDFNQTSFKNDIALFKVCPPFLVAAAVKLPSQSLQVAENTSITVTGWGSKSVGLENVFPYLTFEPQTDLLMESDLLVLSDEKCLYAPFKKEQMCAYLPRGVLGGDCYGDSGGPVLLKTDLTQLGIVSYGVSTICAVFPDVYTEVAHYIPWISARIN